MCQVEDVRNKITVMKALYFTFVFCLLTLAVSADAVFSSDILVKSLPIGNVLTWSTLSETNGDRFVVERSVDGATYMATGEVKATGNSTREVSYDFLDLKADGVAYYRLMYKDLDGNTAYSAVIACNNHNPNRLNIEKVSTTEVEADFVVDFNSRTKGTMIYTVTSMRGDVFQKGAVKVTKGTNSIEIDFTELNDGDYKVLLSLEGEKEKFTVRRMAGDHSDIDIVNNK